MNKLKEIEEYLAKFGLYIISKHSIKSSLFDRFSSKYNLALLVGNKANSIEYLFSNNNLDHGKKNPLDSWTKKLLTNVAKEFDSKIIFPFIGPPYFPFHKLALEDHKTFQSPLGILINEEYGLWFAYRGILLVQCLNSDDAQPPHRAQGPCEKCSDRPCLETCPVNAFKEDNYYFKKCLKYLQSNINSECYNNGCLARRSCPIHENDQYGAKQRKFHMEHFVKNTPHL